MTQSEKEQLQEIVYELEMLAWSENLQSIDTIAKKIDKLVKESSA